MSNMVQNETLMSGENEVCWKASDLQRWLFGMSGSGPACEWSKHGEMWIDEQFSSSLPVDYRALYCRDFSHSKITAGFMEIPPWLRVNDDSLTG